MSSNRFLNANGVYSTRHFVGELTEIDLMKSTLRILNQRIQNNSGNISDLESRVDEIESNGLDSAVIDEINGKITNHQTRIETLETDDVLIKNSVTNVNTKVLQNTEYINELNEELNDLTNEFNSYKESNPPIDLAPYDNRINTNTTAITNLTNEFNSYKESNPAIDLAPYDERINTNTNSIADLKGRVIMMCNNIDKIIEIRNLIYEVYPTTDSDLRAIRAVITDLNNRLSTAENSYATPFLYMCYEGCCSTNTEIINNVLNKINEIKLESISSTDTVFPRSYLDRFALMDLNFRIKLCENLLYKDVYIKPNLNECQCVSWVTAMNNTLANLNALTPSECITMHKNIAQQINTKLTAYENASSIQDALTSIIQRLDALESTA